MKINRRGFFASLFLGPCFRRWKRDQEEGIYFDLGRPADRLKFPTYGSVARKILAHRRYRQGYLSKESLLDALELRIEKAESEMHAQLARDFETLRPAGASKGSL